jgi:hypothetical protein
MSLVWSDPYLAASGNYVNLNYNKMNAKQNILILVKTYPEISRKYVETVCTAGILAETKKMIRLYPVRYRYLEGEFQFKKYQWIRAEIAKAISDSRPESFNLVEGTIEIGDIIGTDDGWHQREEWVINHNTLFSSVEDLLISQKRSRTSLGIVKRNIRIYN